MLSRCVWEAMKGIFFCGLYGILGGECFKLVLEFLVAVLEVVEVLVRIEGGELRFDDRNSDVGAVIGNTFEVVEDVV